MKAMRILLLGAATIALSGCSFLGLGGGKDYKHHSAHSGHHGSYASHNGCTGNNCLSRWNLEGGIGVDADVTGDIVTGSNVSGPGIGQIEDIKFKDVYEAGYRGELGVSYALTPNRKVTATGFYSEAKGSGEKTIGTLAGPAGTLNGEFSDLKTYGAELGLRQYMKPQRGWLLKNYRPYVEGRLGATHVDDISITNTTLSGAPYAGGDIALYDSGWVAQAAGLVGVEVPISRFSTLALETGVRHTQGFDGADSTNPMFDDISDSNGRTVIPVTLRGRYRF